MKDVLIFQSTFDKALNFSLQIVIETAIFETVTPNFVISIKQNNIEQSYPDPLLIPLSVFPLTGFQTDYISGKLRDPLRPGARKIVINSALILIRTF